MSEPTRDIDLMQYADGELEPAERAEVEAVLARDPATSIKVRAIGEASELVRSHLELAADEPGIDLRLGRMWTEIEKGIEREAAPVKAKVGSMSPGLWARVTRWIDAYRGHVLTGALSAGAVAAVALILRPTPAQAPASQIAEGSGTMPTLGTGAGPSPTADPMMLTGAPAEVESLDVPGGTGTVFTIEGEDGEETTVIWVTPDDTVEGL